MTSTPASTSNSIEPRTGRATRSGATYNPHLVLGEEVKDRVMTYVERQTTNEEDVNSEHDDNSDQSSGNEQENQHQNNQHDDEQEPGPRAAAPAQAAPGQAPTTPIDPTGIGALAVAISQLVQANITNQARGQDTLRKLVEGQTKGQDDLRRLVEEVAIKRSNGGCEEERQRKLGGPIKLRTDGMPTWPSSTRHTSLPFYIFAEDFETWISLLGFGEVIKSGPEGYVSCSLGISGWLVTLAYS